MTIELWMLLASAVLMLLFPMIYGPAFIRTLGMAKMVGNREAMPPVEGWFVRLKRAHANHAENLLPFAAVVLVAQAAGVHSVWTRGGAVLFLLARILHAVVYAAGLGPPRTLAYVAGIVGTLMIAGAVAFG